ncbi:hypothetical protein SD37_11565 [Amycolatopsis orientalis]|uniref:HNH nuclease domain-containing protein n=1 Tax=Amycolatopsis orientalis TaxID=31958 RepID=A0A193BVL0_AMYOR|nr:HNH endonuclease [Amycolatopsis orientalis]ANN16215.1 hypothetical protein SD37_11565 [Amycolatopsis orientalis]
MAVTKRLRYEILRRDNHACRYCGATAPDVELTVDHVVPTALGGSDAPTNLVAACKACNAGKSASSPDAPVVADIAADALRWGAALAYAAKVQLGELLADQRITDWFDEKWTDWRTGGGQGDVLPRPADWEQSVLRFIAAGLTFDVVEQSLKVAMQNSRIAPDATWRYFCGVCWRRVTELQEIAHAAIAAQDGHL